MKKLLNTLYVTTPNCYLRLDGENIVLTDETREVGRVPLHNLCGIVCFGYKGTSPALMGACAERGVDLCYLTPHGRFLARVCGPVRGNVLLRERQTTVSLEPCLAIVPARMFLLGKVYNARWTLERTLRDHRMRVDTDRLQAAVEVLKTQLTAIAEAAEPDALMGAEGLAAKAYFSAFDQMVLRNEQEFAFTGRSRRPPLDRINALLSFTYTLLANEIAGALESVGLDPYIGFLHRERPGRRSLALDLLEEFRSPIADRFVLTQINLGSIVPNDFIQKENGAFYLTEAARRKYLAAWQKRKQEEIIHPYLKEKVPWGLIPYVQAMLLTRWLRDDLDAYPPFFWKS